ncbi:hypothetical protein [Rhodococcus sp. NPDC057529]|uniref:hypothetical protein n=1 Tax=Rhodococcus sp. NPDC057529 TaxID=3346158 RepID=UPI003672920F
MHASPFRRASEEELLDLEACLHVGIRGGLYDPSDMDNDLALGFAPVRCDEIEGSESRGSSGCEHAARGPNGLRLRSTRSEYFMSDCSNP